MYGVHSSAASNSIPALDSDRHFRSGVTGAGTADRRIAPGGPAAAICPHRFARWAWGEGLRAGVTVALMVQDLGQAEAMRLGLTRLGLSVVCLDSAGRDQTLADSLTRSEAALVIVDTALASAYAGVMGRLARYPAVWWNGPGADYASLDHALAERA
ncbi:AMP-dependent synthetase [Methylobacterium sp. P5_C11]